MQETKTGKEIVSSFIELLKSDSALDQEVVTVIATLHHNGKLSDKAIANELEALRRKHLDENSKDNS